MEGCCVGHSFPIPQVSNKRKHYKWTYEEDKKLRELVNRDSKNPNWEEIAAKFSNRNPRQCQERWSYYLSPDVNNGPWTPEEDELLLKKFKEFGSRWVHIAQFFKGRTNTNCKNRYLAINRSIAKGEKPIYFKPIILPKKPAPAEPSIPEIDFEPLPFQESYEILDPPLYQDTMTDIDFYW